MPTPVRTAFVFPGQGSQQPGMGSPWRGCAGWSVVDLISGAVGLDVTALLIDADADLLRRTDHAQVAVFALEMVILAELAATGADRASVVATAGHSLGEYAALVYAGILSLTDAARLVALRGAAMKRAVDEHPGGMRAVLAPRDAVEHAVESARAAGLAVWVANVNGPRQVVVAGNAAALDDVDARLVALGLAVIALPVSGAFHTPLMAGARDPLRAAFADVPRRHGHLPVVANIDARPHDGKEPWPDIAARHLVEPVLWADCVQTLATDLGCGLLVEIGPGRTLTGLARRSHPGLPAVSVSTPLDLKTLADLLATAVDLTDFPQSVHFANGT